MSSPSANAARDFWLTLLGLAVLGAIIATVRLPVEALPIANLLISVLFVIAPIYALFRGAAQRWTLALGLAYVVGGAGLHVVGGIVLRGLGGFPGLAASLAGQAGLLMWCLGLGCLLALALKDQNLLIPIAVFLALFDIWLVFAPDGPVGQIARGNQEQLAQIAYSVPRPASAPTGGRPQPLAYIGPADFMFSAMFFAALYRFGLDVRRTAQWLAPVLVAYLLLALLAGDVSIGPIRLAALPALLPIAAVVLAVNGRHFRLTRDEWTSTAVLGGLMLAFVVWRFSVTAEPVPPPTPSSSNSAPEPSATAPTPE